MSTALELIQIIEASGGRFMVEGDRLGIVPKMAAAPVLEQLRRSKRQIIDLLIERGAAIWRPAFEQWLRSACVHRLRDFGAMSALLISFNQCAGIQGGSACGCDVFSWLLAERDYVTGEVHGVALVSGLMLLEDWRAHQIFQESAR